MIFMRKNILLMALMIGASLLAILFRPTHRIADDGPAINLETIIPKQFGEWIVDEHVVYQQVSPDLQEALDEIYTQILTRTYVNSLGYRIMLSIPYGANQSDGLSAHDPEGCYPAQGFKIMSKNKSILHTDLGNIPVHRMEAVNGSRHEVLTYWFTVGRYAFNNDWDRKKAQIRYSLRGQIPDGILFRVSSIDTNSQDAYQIQANFIKQLVKELPLEYRSRISGI